jgi:hypothetical protein
MTSQYRVVDLLTIELTNPLAGLKKPVKKTPAKSATKQPPAKAAVKTK